MNRSIKSIILTPRIRIIFDVDTYAEAYGLTADEVGRDAFVYLSEVATEAVREAVERLVLDASVTHEGTSTAVGEYHPHIPKEV